MVGGQWLCCWCQNETAATVVCSGGGENGLRRILYGIGIFPAELKGLLQFEGAKPAVGRVAAVGWIVIVAVNTGAAGG
jgi:hypothetical protein